MRSDPEMSIEEADDRPQRKLDDDLQFAYGAIVDFGSRWIALREKIRRRRPVGSSGGALRALVGAAALGIGSRRGP